MKYMNKKTLITLGAALLILGIIVTVESHNKISLSKPDRHIIHSLNKIYDTTQVLKQVKQENLEEIKKSLPTYPHQAKLKNMVQALAWDLYDPKNDYDERDIKLRSQLSAIDNAEFGNLAADFLNDGLSIDEKRSALYVLGLAGEKGVNALSAIAASAFRANSEIKKSSEITLRIDCLEKLDLLSVHSGNARIALSNAAQIQKNDILRFFAKIAVAGIRENRPGKLHRFIEQNLINHGG